MKNGALNDKEVKKAGQLGLLHPCKRDLIVGGMKVGGKRTKNGRAVEGLLSPLRAA